MFIQSNSRSIRNEKYKELLVLVTLLFSFGLFIIGILYQNSVLLFYAILAIFFHNILYTFTGNKVRIVFLAFHITFFTFLLGKLVFSYFGGKGFGLIFSEKSMENHVFVLLFISLVFLLLGNVLAYKKDFNLLVKIRGNSIEAVKKVRKVSKIFFFIAYIPYFIRLFERIVFVNNNQYIDYYSSFKSHLPSLFVMISEMAMISFFVFLGTKPSKKECRVPVFLYLLYGVCSLGFGQRNIFVLNFLIVLIYYFLRNSEDKKEKWLRKKSLLLFLVLIPFMISFLEIYSYTRAGINTYNYSITKNISDFFESQGGSIHIIEYAEHFKKNFPTGIKYTFGPLALIFKNNALVSMIFSSNIYTNNTVAMALNGEIFGQTISYLIDSRIYLSGGGFGSCYIAEIFNDFSYIGVIIINFVYGFLIEKIPDVLAKSKNVWVSAIFLMFTHGILYAPRDLALNFLSSTFTIINLLTLLLIYITSKIRFKYEKSE